MDIIRDLSGFAAENLNLLLPVDQAWQPSDFLPDLTAEDWVDQVTRFRESSSELSDQLLVVLVGNMVTEEALPNYSVSLNRIVKDNSGIGDAPWTQWLRGWTAEENRHGDLLNSYLRLTGRVDMRSVEVTIHHLIANGFTALKGGFVPDSDADVYAGLMYTSFQERATRVSHGNVARMALAQGDEALARICRRIAGDESRHETFYTKAVSQIMEGDPEGAVLAFRNLLRGTIVMPGRTMSDGQTPNLYDNFAAIAQRTGTYTVLDYAHIIDHLMKTWKVADLSVSGKAAKAQDYLCQQAEKFERYADEVAENLAKAPSVSFAWLGNRPPANTTPSKSDLVDAG